MRNLIYLKGIYFRKLRLRMVRVSDILVTLTSFDNEGSVEDKPEEYLFMNSSSQVSRYNVMYTLGFSFI